MNFEKERQRELYEYTTTAHMLCLLIFVIAIIISGFEIFPEEYLYSYLNVGLFVLLCSMGAIIVLLYNTRISLLPRDPKLIHWIDLAYIGFPLTVASLTLFCTGRNLPYSESILLLPVFITASIMGKNPRPDNGYNLQRYPHPL
jgi:hypothetical protein